MLPRVNVDYSTKDYEGFRRDLLNLLAQKIPQYTDFSESDAGVVLIELIAHGLDILSYYNDLVANECYFLTAKERNSVIKLAGYLGYALAEKTPAQFMQVFEIVSRNEPTLIPKGFKVKTADGIVFEVDNDFLYPANVTGLEKDVGDNYVYQVPISHGISVNNEILGSSTGVANQKFILAHDSVIKSSIKLYVRQEVLGVPSLVLWTPVDNFIESTAQSNHYVIKLDENAKATIEFGDGVSGRIPPVSESGIISSYRVGGGIIGNVSANTITKTEGSIAVIKSTFNPSTALIAGRDAEDIELAKRRAISGIRTLSRAVTRKDFEDLAMLLPEVVQAYAVEVDEANYNIRLYVLIENSTTLSAEEKALLEAYFADKVVLGTKLDITGPTLVPLDLVVTAHTYPNFLDADVQELIEDAITDYFSAGNFGFGEDYYRSQLIKTLMGIESVEYVEIDVGNTEIADSEIVTLGTLSVTVTGGGLS